MVCVKMDLKFLCSEYEDDANSCNCLVTVSFCAVDATGDVDLATR